MTLGADRLASGGEKTFDVKVNGKKSAQVNVGGMSLQIFEKKGKPPTKTYLYQNMAAWQETAKGFELTMSDDVEYQFSCKEGEGAEICELITQKTTELARMTPATEEPVAEAELQREQLPLADASSVSGNYVVVKKATVRSGFELESTKVGSLPPGHVIEVIEARNNSKGPGVRVCFAYNGAQAWTSITAKTGNRMLEPTDQAVTPETTEIVQKSSQATRPESASATQNAGGDESEAVSPKLETSDPMVKQQHATEPEPEASGESTHHIYGLA